MVDIFNHDQLLDEFLPRLLLYHPSYTDPSWWETSTILSPSFKCEVEQGLVKATLIAREVDVLGNDVITRLINHGNIQQNFLPALTQHTCVILTIDTPSLSHEYDTMGSRLREILEIIHKKMSEIDDLKNLIRANVGDVEEHNRQLIVLRRSVEELRVEHLQTFNRKAKLNKRITKLEKARCSKVIYQLVNFINYRYGVNHRNENMCNFDHQMSAISLRQTHDTCLVALNFLKYLNNYERVPFSRAEYPMDDDDGIEVFPSLPFLNVDDVDQLIDDDDNDVPPRLLENDMEE